MQEVYTRSKDILLSKWNSKGNGCVACIKRSESEQDREMIKRIYKF